MAHVSRPRQTSQRQASRSCGSAGMRRSRVDHPRVSCIPPLRGVIFDVDVDAARRRVSLGGGLPGCAVVLLDRCRVADAVRVAAWVGLAKHTRAAGLSVLLAGSLFERSVGTMGVWVVALLAHGSPS